MSSAGRDWLRTAAVVLTVAVIRVPAVAAQPPAWSPVGLWRNEENGLVMRLQECGQSICSEIVGIPSALRSDARAPKCHDQLLREHTWNAKANRYDGTLSPPGSGRSVRSWLEAEGAARLVLKARMMMMSKTIRFTKFTGTPGADCAIESAAR